MFSIVIWSKVSDGIMIETVTESGLRSCFGKYQDKL